MDFLKDRLLTLFPAFTSSNYRNYFIGQLISQIGTWLQIVAQSWLVLEITNSAFLVGLVAAAATLPSLLFSLFGGVIVDRFSTKHIIIWSQVASLVLAFMLGLLTVTGVVTVIHIVILAFLLGVVAAVDMPARQAFVVEMVEKDKVASAIALNGGIFNAARVVGPGVAGLLIGLVGTGGAFIANAISYIAAIIAVYHIHPKIEHHDVNHSHPLRAIWEGVVYTWTHPVIRSLIFLTAVVSVFGWSYATVLPLIAKNTYHMNAGGLGYLYSIAGLGALFATILVSAFGNKISANKFIIGGNTVFAISLIGFALTSNIYLASVFLFIGGIGLLAEFSIINTQIQHLVESAYRGRVLSVYLLMFVGLFPVGNFQIGYVAEKLNPSSSILVGGVVVLIAGLVMYLFRRKVREAHEEYITRTEAQDALQETLAEGKNS